ncbi:hypothetical protein D3C80_1748440 [compost metagenome]
MLDVEVPILMLQDDGHLVGVFGQDVRRHRDAGRSRLERDVEVVRAGNAVGLGGTFQRRADHAAQGVLGELLIEHLVDRGRLIRHRGPRNWERATVTRDRRATEDADLRKVEGFCCQAPSGPRLRI